MITARAVAKKCTGWNPEQERAKFLKELSQALALHPCGPEWLPKLLEPGNVGTTVDGTFFICPLGHPSASVMRLCTAADRANVKKHFKQMHDVHFSRSPEGSPVAVSAARDPGAAPVSMPLSDGEGAAASKNGDFFG